MARGKNADARSGFVFGVERIGFIQEKHMKVAVIVAHPDDETIWAGGFILRHPEWDWTVLSMCRASDPDRSAKFKAVCKRFGAASVILDLNDSNPLLPIDPRKDIGDRIKEALGERTWDLCLTHGSNGEYGHQRHKEVHAEVVRLVTEEILRCDELWAFAYECDSQTGDCTAALQADVFVGLTEEEFAEKKRIIHEEYGCSHDSFESRACILEEAFRRIKEVSKGVRR